MTILLRVHRRRRTAVQPATDQRGKLAQKAGQRTATGSKKPGWAGLFANILSVSTNLSLYIDDFIAVI
ncbi:hypothetical protein [Aquitalea sp.]|uniref:hypothetical protein n=1 Tax=Aquitalea sp. TaxID=1872623 RepID=UPI00258A7C8F|nr:hypothetical protein [Aquitalea sp.]